MNRRDFLRLICVAPIAAAVIPQQRARLFMGVDWGIEGGGGTAVFLAKYPDGRISIYDEMTRVTLEQYRYVIKRMMEQDAVILAHLKGNKPWIQAS